MSNPRLPAHVEVAALIRAAQAAGGFATVLAKGERDAGAILVVTADRGDNQCLWERMPRLDGRRIFEQVRSAGDDARHFADYLARRTSSDPDAWLIEVDVRDSERLVAQFGH